jgi:hypothetical protein
LWLETALFPPPHLVDNFLVLNPGIFLLQPLPLVKQVLLEGPLFVFVADGWVEVQVADFLVLLLPFFYALLVEALLLAGLDLGCAVVDGQLCRAGRMDFWGECELLVFVALLLLQLDLDEALLVLAPFVGAGDEVLERGGPLWVCFILLNCLKLWVGGSADLYLFVS